MTSDVTSVDHSDRALDASIESAVRSLTTIGPQLPTEEMVQAVIDDSLAASQRGHFTPDEDERVREMFAQYLRTRAGLMTTLLELEPLLFGPNAAEGKQRIRVFAVAYCIACMLVRAGRFLVDSFREDRVIWKKLDEAEPRYGIPAKQFTKIFKSLTSPRNIWIFISSTRFAEAHEAELAALADDPTIGQVIQLLKEEKPHVESSVRYYTRGRLKYRAHSFVRRHVSGFKKVSFALFKLSGSMIAELRMKWKRKRVTPGVRRKIAKMLQPGDVIITRHDDAASNLFLPGFWPHGAYYIGTPEQRRAVGVEMTDERWQRSDDSICVLEARKDGVLFRPIEDTLNVDAFTVLRPQLPPEQIREAITRAITHEGKTYDFEFDFRRSDRLVCTEVIYRAYHGIGPMNFELKSRAGRICLSAEDILDCAIDTERFEVIAVYGVGGNRFVTGDRAVHALISSYRQPSHHPNSRPQSSQ